eukprot:6191972-Pleurochrysis_carterae.AAC.1
MERHERAPRFVWFRAPWVYSDSTSRHIPPALQNSHSYTERSLLHDLSSLRTPSPFCCSLGFGSLPCVTNGTRVLGRHVPAHCPALPSTLLRCTLKPKSCARSCGPPGSYRVSRWCFFGRHVGQETQRILPLIQPLALAALPSIAVPASGACERWTRHSVPACRAVCAVAYTRL